MEREKKRQKVRQNRHEGASPLIFFLLFSLPSSFLPFPCFSSSFLHQPSSPLHPPFLLLPIFLSSSYSSIMHFLVPYLFLPLFLFFHPPYLIPSLFSPSSPFIPLPPSLPHFITPSLPFIPLPSLLPPILSKFLSSKSPSPFALISSYR